MLSIVIPTFNEMKNGYLSKILPGLNQLTDIQVIIVDGHSIDGTKEYCEKFPFELYQIETTSRAARLNYGIKKAKYEMLILHHPRSVIDLRGIQYLNNNWQEYYWGGFTHKFDLDHPLLRFTSWYSNHVRADVRSIFYLDHCLFVRKSLLEEVGLVAEVDIFEDTLLSLSLRKICEGLRLDFYSLTSAIRFTKNGVYSQALMNQKLKLMYYLNSDHQKMNKEYEKKVALNARYNSNRKD